MQFSLHIHPLCKSDVGVIFFVREYQVRSKYNIVVQSMHCFRVFIIPSYLLQDSGKINVENCGCRGVYLHEKVK